MITHDVDRALRDATHILHLHKNETFYGDKESYLECATCRHLTETERREETEGCGHA